MGINIDEIDLTETIITLLYSNDIYPTFAPYRQWAT